MTDTNRNAKEYLMKADMRLQELQRHITKTRSAITDSIRAVDLMEKMDEEMTRDTLELFKDAEWESMPAKQGTMFTEAYQALEKESIAIQQRMLDDGDAKVDDNGNIWMKL